MIDAAAPASWDELQTFIRSLPPKEFPEQVVITHGHEDHAGCSGYLIEEFDLPVYAHERAVKLLQPGYELNDWRQTISGECMPPAKLQPIPPGPITTKTGKITFEVFNLPGHARCLLLLLERIQQWGFSSDLLLPNYKILAQAPSFQENIQQIHNSLVTLKNLTSGMDKMTLFPASYHQYKDGRAHIEQKIAEIELLHRQVHALASQGLHLRKIRRTIFGNEHIAALLTHGQVSHTNLIKSLLEWPLETRAE
jgi:glyoxylase-like metal-dependent hydrolase (beta-lactamase superfamily II)